MITADTFLLFLLIITSLPVFILSYNYLVLILASLRYDAKIKRIMERSIGSINPPKVTIIIPSFNERYLVERSIDSAISIDYPKDRLQTIVADDSTDETYQIVRDKVSKLLIKGYNIQLIHREKRDGFKSGALNNALKSAKGEYILIMDVDSILPQDILKKSIPLMEKGYSFISFKTGHINRGYNWVSRAYALAIDVFETVERAGRISLNVPFSLQGKCSLIRKDQINEVRGWSQDIVVEDMDLSCKLFLNSKDGLFIKDTIVSGEDPPLLEVWKRQTARNAEGYGQCLRKYFLRIWRSRISITCKIELTLLLIWPLASIGWLITTFVAALGLLFNFQVAPSLFQNPAYIVLVMIPAIIVLLAPLYVLRLYGQKIRENLQAIILLPYYQLSMVVSNSISFIKGIFRLRYEFFRRPKYGLKGKEGEWKRRYRIGMNKLSYIELLIAFILGTLSVIAFLNSSYFLGLNLFAFSVITLWSLYMR
ncbi:MAG: glycosyltransferase [archaeon]|nr:glycosyltransferase [archaeon]MCP8315173.1 glycosyltransferase [archaeon]